MIIKGNQRGGARQLAHHLLKDENDHVEIHELRGFMADDLHGAFAETHAIAKATKCTQFLFSVSLNPPQQETASVEAFEDAADRIEKKLGLEGQPRAIVFHEKQGPGGYRRHAHVIWSRIDTDTMTAINLSWYKNKLNTIAKELFLEHGWELPLGFRDPNLTNPLNFTQDQWQQALRTERDPREIKQAIQTAWVNSDCAESLNSELEEKGFKLARGDKRGFVVVDYQGEVYSLPRWANVKTKQVRARLGNPHNLPSVAQVKQQFRLMLRPHVRNMLKELKEKHRQELKPLLKQKREMIKRHKLERQHLKAKQAKRWAQETQIRQARLHKGLRGLWDWLSGRAKQIRQQNEREAQVALKRDQKERDNVIIKHARQVSKFSCKIMQLHHNQRKCKVSLISSLKKRSINPLTKSAQIYVRGGIETHSR